MSGIWLDGWEQIPIYHNGLRMSGGTWAPGYPWRCVLHSTEGNSIEGAVGAYSSAGSPPQTTIDPKARRKAQHLSLDASAYALVNGPNPIDTNRARCVQVEIVMYADEAKSVQNGGLYVGNLTDDDYAWLASVLRELQGACPFEWASPAFVHYPESSGVGAAQRFSLDYWRGFGGICGHQHVPDGNYHGDPGSLDAARLLGPPPPNPHPTPPSEDEMPRSLPPVEDSFGRRWIMWLEGMDGVCHYNVLSADHTAYLGHGTLAGNWLSLSGIATSSAGVMDLYGVGLDGKEYVLHNEGTAAVGWASAPFAL